MKPSELAILFDFDGVLVDSLPVHLKAWQTAFRSLMGQELPEHVLSAQVGKSSKFIATELCKYAYKPYHAQGLFELKNKMILDMVGEISLFTGTLDFLEKIRHLGVHHGIVSNANRDFIGKILDHHQLDFPFYFGIEDYKKPKPDPGPYLLGAKRLGYSFNDHSRVMVFEDSIPGLQAAHYAKMTTVGVCTQHSPKELSEAHAQFTCQTLGELVEKGGIGPLILP